MKSNLKIITDDIFGIAKRLKEIDEEYFLAFNEDLKRFEVHSNRNKGDTLSVVCPYGQADARLLKIVRATRRERAKEIFREVEEKNNSLAKAIEEKQRADAKDRAKELLERLKTNSR